MSDSPLRTANSWKSHLGEGAGRARRIGGRVRYTPASSVSGMNLRHGNMGLPCPPT
ncbi:hypothetical protein ABIA39_002862 [Nocardia sp. GAS34]|uniref:hypothetical protein n=1 Tax=unclassified Nocardia TaxID=2637762 RepID=UPI003D21069F